MEKTIGEQFRSYLLKQEDPSYTIREASDEEGRHIFFETQEASASVTMHTINGTEICELRIVSTKTGRRFICTLNSTICPMQLTCFMR